MKSWLTTRQFIVPVRSAVRADTGTVTGKGLIVATEIAATQSALDALQPMLDDEQFSIVSVTPIMGAYVWSDTDTARIGPVVETKTSKSSARRDATAPIEDFPLSFSAGASVTQALCIVAQRSEMLSDADFDARSREIAERRASKVEQERLAQTRQHNEALERQIIETRISLKAAQDAAVTPDKGGLFRKAGFAFQDQKFETEAQAYEARAARVAELNAKLADLEASRRPVPVEIAA